ncbi:MAG: NAD(P)H-binding protein [Burkholderiaceae bacterium]
MYAITGITGQVGGAAARALLAAGLPVRAVLRDPAKAAPWRALGCEIAVADLADARALARALAGAEAVFVLPPPCFDPLPGLPEIRTVVDAVCTALEASPPQRIVCLSTIGAQAAEPNLLTQLALMERALAPLPLPVTFLRPAWFMENARHDIARARDEGVLASCLQPLDRAIPMVAAADVGRTVAELLRERWTGHRVVELEGPERVSPDGLAAALSAVLRRPVRAQAVPRAEWAARFAAQGMRRPEPRMRMLDGFNEGWIAFDGDDATRRRGSLGLAGVLGKLAAQTRA